jgi:hypothetical protein
MSAEFARIDDDAPDIRSPSPKKHSNILGLGIPPTPNNPSVLTTYPHLGHYIYNLLQSLNSSPPRNTLSGSHHPLSVSSSGESDGERSEEEVELNGGSKQKSSKSAKPTSSEGGDKDELVRDIVGLLDNEEEEEVKERLKPYMGALAKVCVRPALAFIAHTCSGRDPHGSGLLRLHAQEAR